MIFTVIQYLPLLEEEAPSHKLELCKSVNSPDTEGGADSEADSDGDADHLSDVFLSDHFHSRSLNSSLTSHFIKAEFIISFQFNAIQSPPPKG